MSETREHMLWWQPLLHPYWYWRHRRLASLLSRGVHLSFAAKCERAFYLGYFTPIRSTPVIQLRPSSVPRTDR